MQPREQLEPDPVERRDDDLEPPKRHRRRVRAKHHEELTDLRIAPDERGEIDRRFEP